MEAARHWRVKGQRYTLQGEICNHCGTLLFPPRLVCPHCGGVIGQETILGHKPEKLAIPVLHKEPALNEPQR